MSDTKKDDSVVEFIRLTNKFEDMAGYVTITEDILTIEFPLIVELETLYDQGKQALYMREVLPQQIVTETKITFPLKEVVFHLPVREDFLDHYIQAKEFFFYEQFHDEFEDDTENKPKRANDNKDENIISFPDIMNDRKNKPIH